MPDGPPPDSFTSFTFGVGEHVNDKTARLRSDSSTRSPRSLRCERGSPMRPRVCYPYPYLHTHVNEVNEVGVGRRPVVISPFTSPCGTQVNEVNGCV